MSKKCIKSSNNLRRNSGLYTLGVWLGPSQTLVVLAILSTFPLFLGQLESLTATNAVFKAHLRGWITEIFKKLGCDKDFPSSWLIWKNILQEIVTMSNGHAQEIHRDRITLNIVGC